MLYNAHTHRKPSTETETVVRNAWLHVPATSLPSNYLLSFGIHPWYADRLNDKTFELLTRCLKHPSAVAVGECGLDRNRGPALEVQIQTLMRQAEVAQSTEKAIIIHCVKAWSELLRALRDIHTPIVLHGYSGSPATTRQALDHPDIYFSIGRIRDSEQTKMQENLKMIPLNRILAENDVSGIPLAEIYTNLQKLIGCSSEKLKNSIQENFQRVFGSIRFAPNFS